MNEAWITQESSSTDAAFQDQPQGWQTYHDTFRSARTRWKIVPAGEMIELERSKSGLRIGAFGCGEGMFTEALKGCHQVHSFDRVAANETTTACDIAAVPLPSASLDAPIFSLAPMSSNAAAYLREAHRLLDFGSRLHIIEMSRRFQNRDGFLSWLMRMRFGVEAVEDRWKFTLVDAKKPTESPMLPLFQILTSARVVQRTSRARARNRFARHRKQRVRCPKRRLRTRGEQQRGEIGVTMPVRCNPKYIALGGQD